MKTIEEYAKLGEHHVVMDALTLLTNAFVKLHARGDYEAVVYDAAEIWQEKLGWMDLPLSYIARKGPFSNLMPHINEVLWDAHILRFITELNPDEVWQYCKEMIEKGVLDEATNEVLCYGVLDYCNRGEPVAKEITATTPDGIVLKGNLTDQMCGFTWIDMVSPFQLSGCKRELCRNPEAMLQELYDDFTKLKTKENEIRTLFPIYQNLVRSRRGNRWEMAKAYNEIYGKFFSDTILSGGYWLFMNWLSLELYDQYFNKRPTWLISNK